MEKRRSSLEELLAITKKMDAQTRHLGKTGEKTNLVSLGGEITLEKPDKSEEAAEIINRAIDLGVNYIDTAPAYHDGDSESNIGQVMARRRKEVFLASKTHRRSYEGTMELIEASLQRLKTDYLDLYQLHNIRTEQDLKEVFASDGALKAMEQLKMEGTIKNIGITGHKDPKVLLKGIQQYDFDCILMSLNAADIHYRPFQTDLLKEAIAQKLGIIAMKTLARGRLIKYVNGQSSIRDALYYVWSFPINTSIIGVGSLEELDENIELARKFEPLSGQEMIEIEEKTSAYKGEGNFFKYNW
ncbi:MAG: aldo/keto reductase [Bacillota bacterium]